MNKSLIQELTETPEGMRMFQQERAIQDLTEMICNIMDRKQVSRTDLARRLGRSKGYITQLLDGRANMTVRTMSDVFVALGRAICFGEAPLETTVSEELRESFAVEQDMSSPQPEVTYTFKNGSEFATLRLVG